MLLWFLSIEAWILMCTVALLAKYFLHQKWNVLRQRNVPHDSPSLLNLGHARTLFSDGYFEFELEQKKKHGPIWGYYIFSMPRIVIHDPEILQHAFIKEFSNFPNRTDGEAHAQLKGTDLSNGLVFSMGDQWKRTRYTLSTAFSTAKMKQMAPLVEQCIENTLKAFRSKVEKEKGHFVASDIFRNLSLDVICSTAFSSDLNSQDDGVEESQISKNVKLFFKETFFTIPFMFAVGFPFLRSFLTRLSDLKPHILFFHKLCRCLMEQRQKDNRMRNRVDLMQLMIDAKICAADVRKGTRKGLTVEEIAGNAMTMLLAGYETTGTAMTYFAYNLAMHPDIQCKLQEEIDGMYSDAEGINFETVNNLKFLNMCVNENLRLYCPISRTTRVAKNEIRLCGLTIPRGWMIIFPIHAMCHDPEFWDGPMEFRPERMRDISKFHPMDFQPFGSGPRNCIGSKLAIMEIKLAFCKILRHFTIEPTAETPKPPLKLVFNITTEAKTNFSLRVIPRTPCH